MKHLQFIKSECKFSSNLISSKFNNFHSHTERERERGRAEGNPLVIVTSVWWQLWQEGGRGKSTGPGSKSKERPTVFIRIVNSLYELYVPKIRNRPNEFSLSPFRQGFIFFPTPLRPFPPSSCPPPPRFVLQQQIIEYNTPTAAPRTLRCCVRFIIIIIIIIIIKAMFMCLSCHAPPLLPRLSLGIFTLTSLSNDSQCTHGKFKVRLQCGGRL